MVFSECAEPAAGQRVPGSLDSVALWIAATNPRHWKASGWMLWCVYLTRGNNAFDAGSRTDDDGLRVTLNTDGVEFVVCTKREVLADRGLDNQLSLTRTQTTEPCTDFGLPEYVQQLCNSVKCPGMGPVKTTAGPSQRKDFEWL